jgi:hypothetical protein
VLKINQALINAFVTAFPSFPTAHRNSDYVPVLGTAYAELITNNNDQTAYSVSTSDQTDGIFKVILRYPVGKGAIAADTMADSVFATYKVGNRISYSTQEVIVTGVSSGNGYPENGWYKLVLSIRYKAFIRR